MRILVFMLGSLLLAKSTTPLPTMATHKVLSAKAFKEKRKKANKSKPKQKKFKKDRKGKKAHWGALKVRPKN